MAFLLMLKNYLHLYSPLYLESSEINMLDVFSVLKQLCDIIVKICIFKLGNY